MERQFLMVPLITLAMMLGYGCSDYRESGGEPVVVEPGPQAGVDGVQAGLTEEQRELVNAAERTIAEMRAEDPSLAQFFDSAYGYAVFPSVGKGGLILGGARGKGVVYEQGQIVGFATLTQGSVGLQVGGQTFSEILFFRSPAALSDFKSGEFSLAANASAVAIESGAARAADYDEGVAIFTLPRKGLMAEASIGGQRFTYEPR